MKPATPIARSTPTAADFPKKWRFRPFWRYSVGRWEGDTLVVETSGFNDKTEFDIIGHPHSEALQIVERYQRRDFGHMDVEMTFDDPQMYTRPFTIKVRYDLSPIPTSSKVSAQNEKDRDHLKQKYEVAQCVRQPPLSDHFRNDA